MPSLFVGRRALVAFVVLLASCSSMRGPFVDLFRDKEEPAWIEITPPEASAPSSETTTTPKPSLLAARLGDRSYRAVAFAHGLAATAEGHLASAHADGFVRVWGSDGGRVVEVLAHEGGARDVVVADGRLHSVGWDGRWLAWNGASYEVRTTASTPLLAIAAVGERVAVGGLSGSVTLFEGNTSRRLAGHDERVEDLALSPDGRRLASASWDKTVRVYETSTPDAAPRVLRHSDALFAVAFSPDGRTIATGGRGSRVTLWDAESGKKLRQWKAPGGGITSLVFDGDALVATTAEGTFGTWSLQGKLRWASEVGLELRAVLRLDDRYAVGGASGRLRFFDVASGEERAEERLRGEVTAVAFSPDDRRVVVGSSEGSVAIHVMDGGSQLVLQPFRTPVLAVAFEPGGFAAVTQSALVRFDDRGEERGRHNHPAQVSRAIFASDGATVLTLAARRVERVTVASGAREAQGAEADALLAAAFDPAVLVERRGAEAVVGGETLKLPARVVAAAITADGARVAAVSVAKGDAFDVAFGAPDALQLVRVPATDLRVAAFDRTGARLAIAGPYRFVRPQVLSEGRWELGPAPALDTLAPKVIDFSSGRAILLRGHDGGVRAVAFGNTTSLLATGGCDGTVGVWRIDAAF
ncbi:MAG: WD40 repeat domain-containing protein [Deltaproteobacteria bacterium]|jgi:WD40 repeat protein